MSCPRGELRPCGRRREVDWGKGSKGKSIAEKDSYLILLLLTYRAGFNAVEAEILEPDKAGLI